MMVRYVKFYRVSDVRFEGYFDVGAVSQRDGASVHICEHVFHADFAKEFVGMRDRDFQLLGRCRPERRREDFGYDRGQGSRRTVSIPREPGMLVKPAFFLACDELAHLPKHG